MTEEEKITIESMKEEDIIEVLKIEHASFSDPWTYNMFNAELSNPFSYLWVARDNSGVLIGFICFWILGDEAHLLDLAVHPSCRQRGVGSQIIKVSMDYWKDAGLKSAYLEVRESNEDARRLYGRFGFKVITRRPKYYTKPREDAYIMFRDLNCDSDSRP